MTQKDHVVICNSSERVKMFGWGSFNLLLPQIRPQNRQTWSTACIIPKNLPKKIIPKNLPKKKTKLLRTSQVSTTSLPSPPTYPTPNQHRFAAGPPRPAPPPPRRSGWPWRPPWPCASLRRRRSPTAAAMDGTFHGIFHGNFQGNFHGNFQGNSMGNEKSGCGTFNQHVTCP